MNKKCVIGKHYHRLIPCPSYDIAEIETWLSDMAEEGLLLSDDGIFAGIADFEYQGPSEVKYRLEAAQKNNGMWSDNGGNPDDEQIELSEKYSWKYVAKLKDFYIYRSMNPEARELNTDPEVQALVINAVKKRARGSVISALIVLFIYPLVLTRGCLLLSAIAIGSVWLLAALILCVILLVNEIRAFVHLRRLQRSLQIECSAEKSLFFSVFRNL